MASVDINEVARNFVQFYYQTFISNRADLGGLYQPQSMLTFEGEMHQGPQKISEKLGALPLFKVQPAIDTLDAQPSVNGAIMIFITGRMFIDEESNPQRFSQTFHLLPSNHSYYVLNDIFRLNYG